MKYKMNAPMGDALVDTDVIATFAGTVAVECFGVVGMASMNVKDGIVSLLKKEHLSNGIKVNLSGDKLSLDFHIIVSYGVSISAVTQNLTDTVKYKLEAFLGAPIDKINVFVEGVRVID